MIQFFPSRTVALELFGFSVHWYGVMYLLAFVLALILLPYLQRHRGLRFSRDQWAGIVSAAVIGVIVGGRLGYVYLYEFAYYSIRPRQVLAVWNGGMSSHGGFLGVALSVFLYCLWKKYDVRKIADIVVIPAAIGLAFGRIGNLINQELYGTVTEWPWGIVVPGVEGLRHPTQIFAVFKDLTIAALCFLSLTRVKPVVPGRTCALFLILYGIFRFLIEYIRVQEYPLVHITTYLSLSRGQLLTIPIFLMGLLLWKWLGIRDGEGEG